MTHLGHGASTCEGVDDAQAGKAPEAMVVRCEDEPMLDCECRDLDVGDVVAAQPGCVASSAAIAGCRVPTTTNLTAACSR